MNRNEVQSFLIRRFITVIALASVAEYFLITFLNGTILPFAMRIYFGNNYLEGRVSILTILAAIFLSILCLILTLVGNILPGGASDAVHSLADSITSLMVRIFNGSGPDIRTPRITATSQSVFVLVVLVYVVLIVIPYLLAGFVYVRTVIRKMKEIEEAEHQRNLEYEKKRNLMISDIAHDIRTPVTTIAGYSQAIVSGKVPKEEVDDYLGAVMTKSQRLTELVNLLFDYVKLDSEGFTMDRKPLDICETVRECAVFAFDDIEKKGMELDVDIPEEPVMVSADKIHISRAVTNLITNAVKHNESGTKIGLLVEPLEKKVKITVADTGNEIPSELAENLFDPFVMGEKSRTTKNGTGLGLSIVKKTVDMHGGTVELKASSPEGYTKSFVITLDQN
ncbi:MAG: HAMP domain-containing histidine kinase [Clostridiales bacterium]|nr:HAMP domain-containing histidine kinase [Clostridiales bacterium]